MTLLATGDVTIAGSILLNGGGGAIGTSLGNGPAFNPGGAGGAGGFDGGSGGVRGSTNTDPSVGLGPGGGAFQTGATYGAPSSFVSLIPLFGGSGGGGGSAVTINSGNFSGASGGGGGGAIVISSSTKIILNGLISANGGSGGYNQGGPGYCQYPGEGGGGSGGAIRLVAPQISGSGNLQVAGGNTYCGTRGEDGRIRLEAFTTPNLPNVQIVTASISTAPGPVTTASNPALANFPSLNITVANIAQPAVTGGSYSTADISLPQGTTNPVPVTLNASNIPVGTVFTIKVVPQYAASTVFNTSPSTGTNTSSSVSTSVTFPSGQVSVLYAYASFTIPAQVAMLYPLIDGEPVERVMVAANYGEASTVTLLTKSGKELKLTEGYKKLR